MFSKSLRPHPGYRIQWASPRPPRLGWLFSVMVGLYASSLFLSLLGAARDVCQLLSSALLGMYASFSHLAAQWYRRSLYHVTCAPKSSPCAARKSPCAAKIQPCAAKYEKIRENYEKINQNYEKIQEKPAILGGPNVPNTRRCGKIQQQYEKIR